MSTRSPCRRAFPFASSVRTTSTVRVCRLRVGRSARTVAVSSRPSDERRRQLFDIASTPLTAAGRSGWTPLSVLGELALRPEVSALLQRPGRRRLWVRLLILDDITRLSPAQPQGPGVECSTLPAATARRVRFLSAPMVVWNDPTEGRNPPERAAHRLLPRLRPEVPERRFR